MKNSTIFLNNTLKRFFWSNSTYSTYYSTFLHELYCELERYSTLNVHKNVTNSWWMLKNQTKFSGKAQVIPVVQILVTVGPRTTKDLDIFKEIWSRYVLPSEYFKDSAKVKYYVKKECLLPDSLIVTPTSRPFSWGTTPLLLIPVPSPRLAFSCSKFKYWRCLAGKFPRPTTGFLVLGWVETNIFWTPSAPAMTVFHWRARA